MANEFYVRKGLIVSGSTTLTGSLQISGLNDTTTTNKVLVVNTSTGQVFTTASIGGDDAPQGLNIDTYEFVADGTQSSFDIVEPYDINSLIVSVGGLVFNPIDDYTINANNLDFVIAPPSGAVVLVRAFVNATTDLTGSFSGNLTGTASFAENATSASYAPTILPSGIVSSSGQVSYTGLSNIPSGIVSSSTQVTSLLPAGTVSSSGQVSYTGLSNIPAGILSSSTQINNLSGVSASFAQTAATASSFSGSLQVVGVAEFGEGLIVSGGLQVNGGITGSLLGTSSWATNAVSSSFATTASFALNASSAGSAFPFSGSAVITGSLLVSGSGLRVTGSTDVVGNFTATTKSFKIAHQHHVGKSLVYGVLEGPEHSVYARGVIKGNNVITLPDEWSWLVDPESITAQLTPIGKYQKLYVKSIDHPHITIENGTMFSGEIHCYYLIHATRKDVAPLQTVV